MSVNKIGYLLYEGGNSSNPSYDQENKNHVNPKNGLDINVKHNLFLQAFEKPTQIYRYLRTRHVMSPIFIHRTLSYMRRMSRKHKIKKNFDLNKWAEEVISKKKTEIMSENRKFENLAINIRGIVDQENPGCRTNATLEVCLIKVCYRRKKDSSSPTTISIPIGKCEAPVNPSDMDSVRVCVTVYKDRFNTLNSHLVKCYSLQFKVSYQVSQSLNSGNPTDAINNGDADPPSYKRRRIQTRQDFERELLVIDAPQQRCLLVNGEYQIVLQKCVKNQRPSTQSSARTSYWVSITNPNSNTMVFQKGPLLVFNLEWKEEMIEKLDADRLLLSNQPINGTKANIENNTNVFNGNTPDTLLNKNKLTGKNGIVTESSAPRVKQSSRIIYRFLYNNVVIQQTRCSNDLKCPWCSLKCLALYSLLKHLKYCHIRFNFSHISDVKGHKIDVTINENFDGSYSGNPHDLSHSTIGYAFSKNGPVRRSPVTQILFLKRSKYSNFLPSDDSEGAGLMRPYITGHNRLYYQSTDCFPVRPQAIEEDSESETDPEWMRIKTQLMIDEFTDVNEGEKEVMKLWNLHGMRHGFVGDCQIPLACVTFVDHYWKEILDRNLYKNFILHLNNLFDFGVLSASVMRSVIKRFISYRNNRKKEEINGS